MRTWRFKGLVRIHGYLDPTSMQMQLRMVIPTRLRIRITVVAVGNTAAV